MRSHRRFITAILGAALAAVVVLGGARGPAAADQPGTPAAGGGITTEVLGRHPSTTAPGQALALMRVTFAPGSGVTAHTHPGDTVYYLEAGVLQFTLQAGEAQLVHATKGTPAVGAPSAAAPVPLGTAITLHAGDTVYYASSAVQTERNAGAVPAVVLVANLRGVDAPARHFVAGTPAP